MTNNQATIILQNSHQHYTVAILGASHKPNRYANMAQIELMRNGYKVIPIHPTILEIEGVPVVHNLRSITEPIHTLTMYVGAAKSKDLLEDILWLNPKRVIFNPGTESPNLEAKLQQQNIITIQGCTLVMLRTQQF